MDEFALRLASVSCEQDSQIVEGVLNCTNSECQSEFPIVDGVPILLPQLRAYVGENIFQLLARNDLSAVTESILGDCCSQGSVLDSMRQHLSCYVWGHYADLDPMENPDSRSSDSVLGILERGLDLEAKHSDAKHSDANAIHTEPSISIRGPSIDIGCGPGRTTFAVADRTNHLTLGIDLNFSMLRLASRILRTRRVAYPRRRIGLIYDRRDFEVGLTHLESVDFWACDALALPFSDQSFARAVGMNVLDSVGSPGNLLRSIARILQPNGNAILACPYDWNALVTPVEAWVGGHSQRNADSGECVPTLRRLLTENDSHAGGSEPRLRFESDLDGVPWTVRLHDRSSMHYRVHLVHAKRTEIAAASS